MKPTIYSILLIAVATFTLSCSPKDTGADDRLTMARQSLTESNFLQSKAHIDSIQILYPKAFDQIKNGMTLLDSVRRAENIYTILSCDSAIYIYTAKADSMKKHFIYEINKEYQETGTYIPKIIANMGGGVTSLQPGVLADGQISLKSIYTGGKQMHDQIRVRLKEGEAAQSLIVSEDGFNFRFTHLGKTYETIQFIGENDNGVADFIAQNADKAITIAIMGGGSHIYQLPPITKKAVAQSVQLSVIMTRLDSLNTEKEKAKFRNYSLDKKNETPN